MVSSHYLPHGHLYWKFWLRRSKRWESDWTSNPNIEFLLVETSFVPNIMEYPKGKGRYVLHAQIFAPPLPTLIKFHFPDASPYSITFIRNVTLQKGVENSILQKHIASLNLTTTLNQVTVVRKSLECYFNRIHELKWKTAHPIRIHFPSASQKVGCCYKTEATEKLRMGTFTN